MKANLIDGYYIAQFGRNRAGQLVDVQMELIDGTQLAELCW